MMGFVMEGWVIRFLIGHAFSEVVGILCCRSKEELDKLLRIISYTTNHV